MFIPHNHRQFDRSFSEREGRLCHEKPVEKPTDRGAIDPRGWLQTVAEWGTKAAGEVAAFTVESVARIPLGIAEGIRRVADGKMEIAQRLLRKAVNFTATAPGAVVDWVTNIFVEQQELTDEAMANLMDMRLWIEAFEGLNLEDVATTDSGGQIKLNAKMADGQKNIDSKTFMPVDYLKTLTPFERRQRFDTLTMGVIPKDTQEKFGTIFGDKDPTVRRNAIMKKQSTLVSAMEKMYGFKDFGPEGVEADDIARNSLHQLLYLNQTGTDKKFGASGGLKEEFQAHLRRRPGMLTPEGITAELAKGVKPEASLLLGAVKGGVLKQKDINDMMPGLEKKTTEMQKDSADQRRILEETIRASRAELKLGSETMSERWDKAPGWAKLAIVVGIIGGVMKFPKTSAAIGAFFAGKYFLMKDNNPIDSTGQTLLSAIGFLRGTPVLPPLGQSKAVTQLGEQVLSFLPNRAHENINTSVTGFTLLAGLDVSLMATHFEPDEESKGRMGWLRAWDQPLKTEIKGSLKRRGLDPAAAGRFFPSGDPRPVDADGNPTESVDCSKNRNLCETGDALASFFYLLGEHRVKTGTHSRKTLNMATLGLIEQARLSSTGSGYYDDIDDRLAMNHPQHGNSVNIRDEYYKVMLEGIDEARNRPGQTLEQVMRELAARPETRVAGGTPKEKGAATEMASRGSSTEANREQSDASTARGGTATDTNRGGAAKDADRGAADNVAGERSAQNDVKRGSAPDTTSREPATADTKRDSSDGDSYRDVSDNPSNRSGGSEPSRRDSSNTEASTRSSENNVNRSSAGSRVQRENAAEKSSRSAGSETFRKGTPNDALPRNGEVSGDRSSSNSAGRNDPIEGSRSGASSSGNRPGENLGKRNSSGDGGGQRSSEHPSDRGRGETNGDRSSEHPSQKGNLTPSDRSGSSSSGSRPGDNPSSR